MLQYITWRNLRHVEGYSTFKWFLGNSSNSRNFLVTETLQFLITVDARQPGYNSLFEICANFESTVTKNILEMAVAIHCALNRVFLDCIRYVNIEMLKKVKLFLSTLWRSVGIVPLILNLDIKRRYVVRFNPRWLCPWQGISGNSNMMLHFFCSVWVWNVVCHPQRGTLFEHVWV
jgi:hypothetical protein